MVATTSPIGRSRRKGLGLYKRTTLAGNVAYALTFRVIITEVKRMAKRRLNEKQLAAVAILSLPGRGGLTYKQVAERVGIAESTLHEWRKLDEFNDEIKKQVLRNAVADLPDMYASIPKHVIEEGNAALFRTYLQSLGMLTEKVEVNSTSDSNANIDELKADIERLRQREKTHK